MGAGKKKKPVKEAKETSPRVKRVRKKHKVANKLPGYWYYPARDKILRAL